MENKPCIQEKFEKIFSGVVKSFSEIKEGEIKFEYDSSLNSYAYTSFFDYSSNPKRSNPRVIAGRIFSNLGDWEKEAILAHELGHYCRMKSYSAKRLERVAEWFHKACFYTIDHTRYSILRHKIERLQKWSNLNETYADNLALKAGYGNQILQALKETYKRHYERLSMIGKKCAEARIKHLEEILGNKREDLETEDKIF